MSSAYQPSSKRLKTDCHEKILPTLNDEAIVSILQWLPVKKLIQLECVCSRWKYLLIPRSFASAKRKYLKLKDYLRRPYCRRCNPPDKIAEFTILTKLLDMMGSHLTSINLNCSHTRIGPKHLQLLKSKCPNLCSLVITRYPTSGECLSLLPATITSIKVRFDAALSDLDDLETFLKNHSGLKQLWFKTTTPVASVPLWLAQYCTQLTHLNLFALDDRGTVPISFVDVFPSLTHLKELEVRNFSRFSAEDLESLCINCPDLEVLNVIHSPVLSHLTVAEAMLIGNLKKLKRLELWHPIRDQSVLALCEGLGATLEYFHLQPNYLTDASLRTISRYCHRLEVLRFQGTDRFTTNAMENLIREIVGNPSWNDPVEKRHLHIEALNWTRYRGINLVRYWGRVDVTRFGCFKHYPYGRSTYFVC